MSYFRQELTHSSYILTEIEKDFSVKYFMEIDKDTTQDKKFKQEVCKGSKSDIRTRIDTLLFHNGLKWSEVYSRLGLSKSHASLIHNGLTIPTLSLRVKIAQLLNSDTSVIWTLQDLDYENYLKILKEEMKENESN